MYCILWSTTTFVVVVTWLMTVMSTDLHCILLCEPTFKNFSRLTLKLTALGYVLYLLWWKRYLWLANHWKAVLIGPVGTGWPEDGSHWPVRGTDWSIKNVHITWNTRFQNTQWTKRKQYIKSSTILRDQLRWIQKTIVDVLNQLICLKLCNLF